MLKVAMNVFPKSFASEMLPAMLFCRHTFEKSDFIATRSSRPRTFLFGWKYENLYSYRRPVAVNVYSHCSYFFRSATFMLNPENQLIYNDAFLVRYCFQFDRKCAKASFEHFLRPFPISSGVFLHVPTKQS